MSPMDRPERNGFGLSSSLQISAICSPYIALKSEALPFDVLMFVVTSMRIPEAIPSAGCVAACVCIGCNLSELKQIKSIYFLFICGVVGGWALCSTWNAPSRARRDE